MRMAHGIWKKERQPEFSIENHFCDIFTITFMI